jgi:hypothetical protein
MRGMNSRNFLTVVITGTMADNPPPTDTRTASFCLGISAPDLRRDFPADLPGRIVRGPVVYQSALP